MIWFIIIFDNDVALYTIEDKMFEYEIIKDGDQLEQ